MKKLLFTLIILFPCNIYADVIDAYNSTCRIIGYVDLKMEKSGTGVLFDVDKDYAYILTCGHILDLEKYKIQFHSNGIISELFPTQIYNKVYEENTVNDLGILKVELSEFGDYELPTPIKLANKRYKPSKGTFYLTVGCARGSLPTLLLTKLEALNNEEQTWVFTPNCLPGRSGSALFTKDGNRIIGILIWSSYRNYKGSSYVPIERIHKFLDLEK